MRKGPVYLVYFQCSVRVDLSLRRVVYHHFYYSCTDIDAYTKNALLYTPIAVAVSLKCMARA